MSDEGQFLAFFAGDEDAVGIGELRADIVADKTAQVVSSPIFGIRPSAFSRSRQFLPPARPREYRGTARIAAAAE